MIQSELAFLQSLEEGEILLSMLQFGLIEFHLYYSDSLKCACPYGAYGEAAMWCYAVHVVLKFIVHYTAS